MDRYIGQTVRGYELQEFIGAGGQSAVYKAYQAEKERYVAVKVVQPEFLDDPETIRRFQIEAMISFRLKHPHIVSLYDYWQDERGAWLVMRWLEGGSLRNAIEAGGLSLSRTADMLDQIAAALNHTHEKNVIHRDIKPDNILFDKEGNAYVHDFGVAKRTHVEGITTAEAMVGSPAYLSPEQIQRIDVTPSTDVYILAVTLFETLTGKHPFAGTHTKMQLIIKHLREPFPSLQLIRSDMPEAVDIVLQKAASKAPEERYPDVLSFATAFRTSCEKQK